LRQRSIRVLSAGIRSAEVGVEIAAHRLVAAPIELRPLLTNPRNLLLGGQVGDLALKRCGLLRPRHGESRLAFLAGCISIVVVPAASGDQPTAASTTSAPRTSII
jgi:hypothetical protein